MCYDIFRTTPRSPWFYYSPIMERIRKLCYIIFFVICLVVSTVGLYKLALKLNQVEHKVISGKELTSLTIPGNGEHLKHLEGKLVRIDLAPGNKGSKETILNFHILDSFEKHLENMEKGRKNYTDFIDNKKSDRMKHYIFICDCMSILILLIIVLLMFVKKIKTNKLLSVGTLIYPVDITVRFRDIGGYEEAKNDLTDFINVVMRPDKYVKLGAKLPKGAILTGLTGTGKSLLAKATAWEAKASFLAVSGAEFDMHYMGDRDATRLRELFERARKNSPCILFIDEIDAVLSKTAMNQLLAELDGLTTTSNVIVLAATNRIDSVNKALFRKGRLDRKINVLVPNVKTRAKIFKCHLRPCKTHLDKKELSTKLAALTHGLTGADIAHICNEAAIIAARYGSSTVDTQHFEQAIQRHSDSEKVIQPWEKEPDSEANSKSEVDTDSEEDTESEEDHYSEEDTTQGSDDWQFLY